jgi:hypothetical protein
VLSWRPLMGRRMTQPKCPRCQQSISVDETVALDSDQIGHLNCRRPRELSQEERTLLFKYCIGHAVATCRSCAEGFRPHEPVTDLSGNHTHLCPRCRADLIDSIRAHLYGCAMLSRPERIGTRELREVTRKVIEPRQQPADHAGPLSRETEAILSPSA